MSDNCASPPDNIHKKSKGDMNSRVRAGLAAFTLAVLCFAPLPARAALVDLTGLFVFGDSLSDGGNSGLRTQQFTGDPNVVFPPPPYAGGRYSNGPTAVEYLWNSYNPGNPGGFQPSLAGGTNYAIGGATTGTANFNTVNPNVPPGLRPAFDGFGNAGQLGQFLSSNPKFDPATSLFVVWLFPNDVFGFPDLPAGKVVPGLPDQPNFVANGIANILATIQILTDAGARHFLVPNMADLGQTPAFRESPQSALLSATTLAFNTNLKLALDALDDALPAEIVQFDTDGAFAAIRKNPAAYGFTNTTQACVDNLVNGLCNPATWLFWDGVHPTTVTHQLLASQFQAAVPEPSSVALLAAALFAIGWFRRVARA